MTVPIIETDYIEFIITLVIFIASYFLATKIFNIKENAFLYTAIFSLFIILMLMAFNYHLYASFSVILIISGLIIYAYVKPKSEVVDNE